ncbi:MAG TPA: GNAT family N-acetyltransferase [Patescibacteria group bacterium]
MSSEQENLHQQAFFESFRERILAHLPLDGSEVTAKYRKEQFTICLQKVSRGKFDNYSVILASYKKRPFRREMWFEPIGHIDINITAGKTFLSTSPIPDEVSRDRLALPLQASEIAFTDESVGAKINALGVEENYRGKGYGLLLYALGKAILRDMDFDSMSIIGDQTEGFYKKLGAIQTSDLANRQIAKLTFNDKEQNALNQLKIVRP